MGIKFTATLPIKRTDKLHYWTNGYGKKQFNFEDECDPYTNPLIEKLIKKLKKVKGQRWTLTRKGNFITITSVI